MRLAILAIFQVVIALLLTAFSCCSPDDSECFVKPQGVQHVWNFNETLKIDIFIPPKLDQTTEHNLKIAVGKMSYILNWNQRSMLLMPRTFISYPKELKPKAGWTSIFVFYRNNSLHFEDNNNTSLLYPQASLNLPSIELTHVNVTVKGLRALINCHSNIKTFIVKPDYKDNQAILGMPIPVTFFNNNTRLEFFGNTSSTVFELQLMLKVGSFFICKTSTDPSSHELTIINSYNHVLCGLLPTNVYILKLNLSILDQRYIESNYDVAVGIVRIYSSPVTIYVRTFSSNVETYSRTDDNEAKSLGNSSFIHYLPALIAVSISLAVIILLVIGAIVFYKLRQKAERKQDQMHSSGSWTQQNFASINSTTDFYIRNDAYQQPGTKSSKKFSITSATSEYSNSVDGEYDEPIYSDEKEPVYDSIYESA